MVIVDRAMLASDAPHVAYVAPSAAQGDARFEEALADASNMEMDWLWLAQQVARAEQRAYCYLRALEINPASGAAQRGLAQVIRRDGRSAVIGATLISVARR